MISWFSKKQTSVALSSVEADYMATSIASCEVIWLRKLLIGLFDEELEPTVIYCDNRSCIKLSENPVFHDRSKHIEIMYNFIRDRVQKGAVKLQYISTDEQAVDILTKPLVKVKFVFFGDKLGVVENTLLAGGSFEVCSIGQVSLHWIVFIMWRSSLIPLRTLDIRFNNLIIKVNVILELIEIN
jgi:hypothetical protein